ncbi:unnamed protein product, partial [Ascophyllum nodosum]
SRYGSSPGYGCRSSAIRTTGGRRGLWRTLGRRPAPGTSAGRSRTSRAPRALRRGSAAGPCSSTFPLFGIRRRSGPATRRWCASPRRGGWTSWSSRSTLPREEGRVRGFGARLQHRVPPPQDTVRILAQHPAVLHSLLGPEDHPNLVDARHPQSPRAQGLGEGGLRRLQA